ncbi:type II toxin-antitoxin system RelE/ParE family toxin [Nitrosomonas sp.]|uniref:type II toxin-antitoxin system RelE/ParE family toxin n=1 Tax=Nitrosomonas sp. TaxID=42353 RepID=UPI0026136834|nr:type II toxin-antitoxin system RelE/ParE family toxin [Nitrosomonas sp.]
MAEIVWTEEAERWLHDIYDYIAEDNPATASKVVTGIFEKTQVLYHFPEIGQKYRAESEGEVRVLYYGHYRIAYLLRSSQDTDILGVFHGALDIKRYLP